MLNSNLKDHEIDYVVTKEEVETLTTPKENEQNSNEDHIFTYDEAVHKIGTGKFHKFILFVSGLCLLGVVTEGMNMGMVLPSARCHLAFTVGEQGILNSIGFIGIFISSHFWGLLADTWGRHKVLRLTSICSFICSAISSFSTAVWMLLVTRFFVGFFISGVQASSLSYLGEFHSDKTRKQSVTIAAMCMTLSVVYMGFMAWLIIPMTWTFNIFGMIYTPWRLYILCSSLTNVIAFISLLFLPESPKFLLAMGNKDEALEILQNVYSMNTGNSKESYPVKKILLDDRGANISDTHGFKDMAKLAWKQTWPLFMPPHVINTVMMSFLMFSFYSIAHGLFLWFPGIFTAMTHHINESNTVCDIVAIIALTRNLKQNSSTIVSNHNTNNCIPTTALTFQIIMIIGIGLLAIFILFIFLVNRIKLRLLLTIWITITALAGLSIVCITNFYLIIIVVVTLFSCGNCASALSAISADLFPTNIKAMALCLILMLGRSGAVAGSNFIAALINVNCNAIFFSCCGLLFCCVLVLIVLLRPKSKNVL